MLIGREHEQRSIENLLAQARSGASAALVIRGEAGIGKTAVLEHAAAGSRMRALRCTGVESEHDLPFAGLEQLFRPVIEMIERLPGPQAAESVLHPSTAQSESAPQRKRAAIIPPIECPTRTTGRSGCCSSRRSTTA